MDLAGYRARVRRLSGLRLESLLPDADLDATVNETYLELAGLSPWPQFRVEDTETFSEDDDRVTLPNTMRTFSSVVLPAGGGEEQLRLRRTTRDELDRLDAGTGPPVLYAVVDDRELVLYPTPDADGTLEVRGQRKPNLLVADTDVPEFDSEFHPIVAWISAARLLAEEGDDSGRREAYAGEASDMLSRMRERYLGSSDTAIFVMGGGGRRHPRSRVAG